MKIRTETDGGLAEPEIVLRLPRLDDDGAALQQAIMRAVSATTKLRLERDGRDFYLPPANILFFEAEDGKTFAHTATKLYRTRAKLYELEQSLPHGFQRVSKSAIVNVGQILSLRRNLAGPSRIGFRASHKQLYVSRGYLKQLEKILSERSM